MGSAAARPKATIRTPKNDPAKKAIASQIIVTASSGSIRSCSRCLGHLAVVATSFNWFAASPADSVIHRTLAVTVSTTKAHNRGAIGPHLPQSLHPSTRPARRHWRAHLGQYGAGFLIWPGRPRRNLRARSAAIQATRERDGTSIRASKTNVARRRGTSIARPCAFLQAAEEIRSERGPLMDDIRRNHMRVASPRHPALRDPRHHIPLDLQHDQDGQNGQGDQVFHVSFLRLA